MIQSREDSSIRLIDTQIQIENARKRYMPNDHNRFNDMPQCKSRDRLFIPVHAEEISWLRIASQSRQLRPTGSVNRVLVA